MRANEFGEFALLMRQFEKIFSKKIDDETMQLYFRALNEVPLSVVRRKADDYLKRAKFFPKPSDLRPKDEPGVSTTRSPSMDAAFKEAEERCIRNLEELRREDPERWRKEVTLRKLDRLIATTEPSHPAYPGILREWRISRGIHVGEREGLEYGPT